MAQLVRVFTVPTAEASPIADNAIPSPTSWDVVIDAKASTAQVTGAVLFIITISVIDLTTATVLAGADLTPVAGTDTPANGTPASMGGAAWPATSRQFRYTAGAFGRAGAFLMVTVALRVGAAAAVQNVDFDTTYLLR